MAKRVEQTKHGTFQLLKHSKTAGLKLKNTILRQVFENSMI